jgi:hypothetical protein
VETCAWANHYFGRDECFLKNSFNIANDILSEMGYDGVQQDYTTRYSLPTTGGTFSTWTTSGLTCLPTKVKPATEMRIKH